MSVRQRIQHFRQIITVEPIIALYSLVHFNRLAIEFGVKDSFSLDEPLDYLHYRSLQYFIIPAVLLLFLAAYSDQYCLRKPFLLLPLLGELISTLGFWSCVTHEGKCPPYLYTILKIIPACFGGLPMLWTMASAYVADITNFETRTFRMGVLDIMPLVGDLTLKYCGVFGFTKKGIMDFTIWGSLNSGLLVVAIVYTIFWLEDHKHTEENSTESVLQAINPRNVVKTFKTLLIKRAYRGRSVTLCLLCLVFVYMFIVNGNQHFIQTQYFEFSDYANYEPFRKNMSLILFLGQTFSVFLFIKLLRLDDIIIVMTTLGCLIVSNIMFGLAESVPMLYAAKLFSIASTLIPTVSKSMMTKGVSGEDFGKITTLFSLCFGLGIALADRYQFVYENSKHASGYFYFGAIFLVNFVLVLLWIYVRNRKERRREEAGNFILDDQRGYEIVPV